MRSVWRRNVDAEMAHMEKTIKTHPLIAFDTEFPGTIIHQTHFGSSDDDRYRALKANVEGTKLIQCGLTLFNSKGEIGGTWEINFSNFGDPSDRRNETSIEFLRRHGLDLNKIRNEGIDMFRYKFFPKLINAFRTQRHVEFVTFQGAYDFAYFLCVLNGKLPETRGEFALDVVKVFGEVYDLKVMAGYCEGLGEHLGLSRLAQELKIARVGRAHHAGSDSLMTALVFIKLKQVCEDSKLAKGMLYGIGKRNIEMVNSFPLMSHQVSYPTTTSVVFCNGGGFIPSYEVAAQPYYIVVDPSSCVPCYPWVQTQYNGMYQVNQINQVPYAYSAQTPYDVAAGGAGYLGPVPNYYNNNNACFVVE